mgnify:CR=1 FL=1
MSHEENFKIAINGIASSNHETAISLLTGALVGLIEFLVEGNGGDPKKEIMIDGGENRDLTIHANKEHQ